MEQERECVDQEQERTDEERELHVKAEKATAFHEGFVAGQAGQAGPQKQAEAAEPMGRPASLHRQVKTEKHSALPLLLLHKEASPGNSLAASMCEH